MLRSWCRTRPVANLAVFHGALRYDVSRAAGLRRLYSTPVTTAEAKKKAPGPAPGPGPAPPSTKAELRIKKKKKKKQGPEGSSKAAGEKATEAKRDDAKDTGAPEEGREKPTAKTTPKNTTKPPTTSQPPPPHKGPGTWMSLGARLRGMKQPEDIDDEVRVLQGEGEPAFFIQEAMTPVEQVIEAGEAEELRGGEEALEDSAEAEEEARMRRERKAESRAVRLAKHNEKMAAKAAAKTERKAKKKGEKSGKTDKTEKTDKTDKTTGRKKRIRRTTVSAGEEETEKAPSLDVKTIRPGQLHLQPVEEGTLNVPRLSYNLDRALFNPGVYHIQDPRSRVFNFDPYLTSIMPVDEFDFDALTQYVTSSKDVKLRELSAAHGLKYCGSTSSMTSMLAHFHFLLSAWRLPNLSTLSRSLEPESLNFTSLTRGPAAAFAHFKDGVYAIDADKEYDTENILSSLGKSMEKLLTLPKEDFEKYRLTRSHQLTEEEKNAEESYHYTTLGDFMMRSQLDAHDPRLPGTGMFDLKTRAVVSIRMDVRGYEKGVGYEIRERFGQWESFEREYYDMIRAAFLKYSLQVRMGRMDGIFVAFHNTRRIFGFQYISLSEMDHALHGTPDTRLGDEEFKASIALLNELLNRASERYPGRSLRLHVETRPTKVPLTYFFVEPVTEEEMQRSQEAGKRSMEERKRDILSMTEEEEEGTLEPSQPDENTGFEASEAQSPRSEESLEQDGGKKDEAAEAELTDGRNDAAWESMMSKVEETIENESLGIGSVREAVQDALEHSGLLADKTELETEKCLDAMVESLAAHSAKIRSLRQGSSDDGESFELSRESEEEVSPVETAAEVTPARGISLKDLILKATEDISTKQNLTTFQQMFADLATKSRASASEDLEARVQDEVEEEEEEDEEEEEEEEDEDDEDEVVDVDVNTNLGEEEQLSSDKASEEVQDGEEAQDEDEVQDEEKATSAEEEVIEEDAEEQEDEDTAAEGEGEGEESTEIEGQPEGEAPEGETEAAAPAAEQRELMGMYVTIRNKVNGKSISRPDGNDKNFDWSIEYAITELPAERAHKIYADIKKRRRTVLSKESPESSWHKMFKGLLPVVTKRGELFREARTLEEATSPLKVAWDDVPIENGNGLKEVLEQEKQGQEKQD